MSCLSPKALNISKRETSFFSPLFPEPSTVLLFFSVTRFYVFAATSLQTNIFFPFLIKPSFCFTELSKEEGI